MCGIYNINYRRYFAVPFVSEEKRKKFLDEFGMYANGKNIFGEKVYQTYDIKPGKYKVKIELESGESFTDTIIVRDDPIKSN